MENFIVTPQMNLPRAQEINLHARKMARAQSRMLAEYRANVTPAKRPNGLLLSLISALAVVLFSAVRR